MFQRAFNLNLFFYTCGRCPTVEQKKNAHLSLYSLPLSISYAALHLGSILYSDTSVLGLPLVCGFKKRIQEKN